MAPREDFFSLELLFESFFHVCYHISSIRDSYLIALVLSTCHKHRGLSKTLLVVFLHRIHWAVTLSSTLGFHSSSSPTHRGVSAFLFCFLGACFNFYLLTSVKVVLTTENIYLNRNTWKCPDFFLLYSLFNNPKLYKIYFFAYIGSP